MANPINCQCSSRNLLMNFEFITNLDKSKTFDNASQIEALKKLYLLCELAQNKNLDEKGACSFCDMASGQETNGHKIDDRCYVFNCENGTVRLTLVDNSTVLVEASPTGTDDMYTAVGQVSIDTGLKDAIKMGCDALNNDALVEGVVDSMKNFGKKVLAPAALAIAPSIVGCAGNVQNMEHAPLDDKAYIASEYNIDTSKELDNNAIPTLVAKISEKLAEQAKNNVEDNYSVATVPAAEEAKNIYQMLKTGKLDVPVVKLPPRVHKEVYDEYSDKKPEPEKTEEEKKAIAQQNAATAFARGLRQEFHNALKQNGIDELLKEMN